MFDIHTMRRSIREIFEDNIDMLPVTLDQLYFYDQFIDQNDPNAPEFYVTIIAPNNRLNITALGNEYFDVDGQLIVEINERKRVDSDGGLKIDNTLGSFLSLVAGQVTQEGVEFRAITFGEGEGNSIYNSIIMAVEFNYQLQR